jgi:hypothetical protein
MTKNKNKIMLKKITLLEKVLTEKDVPEKKQIK